MRPARSIDRCITTRCGRASSPSAASRSEEHTSELQSRLHLVCRLLLGKKTANSPSVLPVGQYSRVLDPRTDYRLDHYCCRLSARNLRPCGSAASVTIANGTAIAPSHCH